MNGEDIPVPPIERPPPESPPTPLSGMIGALAYDITREDTIDAVIAADAQRQLMDIVTTLQGQITALAQIVADQNDQLARTTAALQCLDCPDNVQDPNFKERTVASIKVCMDSGICTCDVGYVLEIMPPKVQTWPGDADVAQSE